MKMHDGRYLHYDVFTSHRFEGNQLAVFLDGRGLDTATMQAIAKEMNFSESTFILPAEQSGTDVRMRIFTPGSELPMAGHPTIGSTFALAHTGVITPDRSRFVFGLGVGPTPVELQWTGDQLAFAWMDQLRPEVRRVDATAEELALAVGVDTNTIATPRLPIEEISCGVAFIMLPLVSREAVDGASPNPAAMRALRSAFGDEHVAVFLFTTDGGDDDVTAYSRMFAPGFGVLEDPATGSASGPLGCYLVRNGLVPRERAARIVSHQGVAMGRPSRIHVAITISGQGAIERVQVGGQAVLVAEGRLAL
jgi:trans-2,3-dihydro-3-hydroxyanthranilate isomerase